MSSTIQRWMSPRLFAALVLVALAMMLAFRETLGIEVDPFRLISASFVAGALMVIVAKFPAAFVAPVLFLPHLKDVPALSGFGPISRLTALELACGLLAVGIFLRWVSKTQSDRALWSRPESRFFSKEEKRTFLPGPPVKSFLFFAAVVAFSYLYSTAPHYGSEKVLAFSTLGCGMFFAPFLLFSEEADFWDFTFGTTLFALVVAASSLSFSATGAMGTEDNPAHIGKGQVIGLAILLLVYTPVKKLWLRRVIVFMCIPALAIGLVSAETRGPLFSLSLVLLLSFFLASFRSPVISRRQMAFVGAALVGAVILLSAFWFYGAEAFKFQYKAAEIVNLAEGNNQAKGTAVERLVFYRSAIELWTERPILGWGLGGWSMAYRQVDDRDYPHNLFCEVLVEQGLIGLAALILFLGAVFRTLRPYLVLAKTRMPSLLPVLVYMLLIAMFSGDLDDDRFIWFWCGVSLVGSAFLDRIAFGNRSSDHSAPASLKEVRATQPCNGSAQPA